MTERETAKGVEESDELTRFQRLARALFRFDKKDVPKHEPKKRQQRSTNPATARRE